MKLQEFLERVISDTKKELMIGDTFDDLFRHTAEELGEVAAAYTVEKGIKNKKLKESAKSEAVDLIICAFSLLYALDGTTEDLLEVAEKKLSKWEERIRWTPQIIKKLGINLLVSNNKEDLEKSSMFACFYCNLLTHTNAIKKYTSDNSGICPVCGVDALIGNNSGYPLSDPEFYQAVHGYLFSTISAAKVKKELKKKKKS